MHTPDLFGPSGKPRARGLGLPFPGRTGPWNAITDVPGVQVGYTTLIEGDGPLRVGSGPVRTGVSVIHPRGTSEPFAPVWAGRHSFNGNGEMTGTHWIDESGSFYGPIAITNTHSVGMAHHSVIRWLVQHPAYPSASALWLLPVVAETYDGFLNDVNGLHVKEPHVLAALDGAESGPVAEGNVGGGTGMICYEFKGGSGTASRVVHIGGLEYRVGVFVQANFGKRESLHVLGVPVGRFLSKHLLFSKDMGSLIVVAATDAPLLPIQLQRMARRAALGMGRTGTFGANGSGDIFLAFSTAMRPSLVPRNIPDTAAYLHNDVMDPLFQAAVEASEEAIINALVAADTMQGVDHRVAHAVDHGALLRVLRQHDRV